MDAQCTDSEFVVSQVETVVTVIDEMLDESNRSTVLGSDLADVVRPVIGAGRVTASAVVRLALLNDCLRLAESAINADGRVSAQEISYAGPLARAAARYLAELRTAYADFIDLSANQTEHFLQVHQADRQLFGGSCSRTDWRGLDICQRISELAGDYEPAAAYQAVMLRLVDEIFELGDGSADDQAARHKLATLIQLRTRLERAAVPTDGADARVSAFCSPAGPTVFHAIAHAHQIWQHDPFDVETVHAAARTAFGRAVSRIQDGVAQLGSILLVLGDSGSGKTHLMRAFRNTLHGQRLGYAAYLQMSANANSYVRYALIKLIEGLQQPYDAPEVNESGLICLSDAVVTRSVPEDALARLREESFSQDDLGTFTSELADEILGIPQYSEFDVDLLRAMLYLQRRDSPIQSRVLKYLRCENLNEYDRACLGGIAPLEGDECVHRMIEQIGRLMWSSGGGTLVFLVDQLEDIFHLEHSADRVRRAMDVVRHITDQVPNAVFVIACLEDFYTQLKPHLARSVLDRIERDPEPVHLDSRRNFEDIEQIVSRRVQFLYESQAARHHEDEPLFPFTATQLEKLTNLRTRDVLDWCRQYQAQCMAEGRLVDAAEPEPTAPGTDEKIEQPVELELLWDAFRTECSTEVPDDDAELAKLLSRVLVTCADELEGAPKIVVQAEGSFVEAQTPRSDGTERLTVGICNKAARGGHLSKQVRAVRERAKVKAARVVLVRCSEYPRAARTTIARDLGDIIREGGRKVVIEDADWRAMLAFHLFRNQHSGDPRFIGWLREAQPLTQLASIRKLLDVETLRQRAREDRSTQAPSKPPSLRPEPDRPSISPRPSGVLPASAPDGVLLIGETRSLLSVKRVELDLELLKTHAAFLGSTNSGKTTVALNIVEQAALRGIPAVLVDRKGDLCTYAQHAFWQQPPADPKLANRMRELRERLDVHVFTPGNPDGRPLSIPLVPAGIGALSAHERSIIGRYAAAALASMMGYKATQADQARLGILTKALELLSEISDGEDVGIPQLVGLLAEEDPSLVNAIGHLDPKHFRKLVEHLETLRLTRGELLAKADETLTAERLFGIGSTPAGKTRLSIISTKLLGDGASVDFWVSRLLLELGRWAAKHPSPKLQALVLFDEADIYLPAQSKPATKEPMMDLLKRARSAGLGVLIATQSPGDLDYKCRDNIRTWFVGRVAEKTAVDKMKPLLSEARINISAKLASARVGEFFMLSNGNVSECKTDQAVMRTVQLSELEIMDLARGTKAASPV